MPACLLATTASTGALRPPPPPPPLIVGLLPHTAPTTREQATHTQPQTPNRVLACVQVSPLQPTHWLASACQRSPAPPHAPHRPHGARSWMPDGVQALPGPSHAGHHDACPLATPAVKTVAAAEGGQHTTLHVLKAAAGAPPNSLPPTPRLTHTTPLTHTAAHLAPGPVPVTMHPAPCRGARSTQAALPWPQSSIQMWVVSGTDRSLLLPVYTAASAAARQQQATGPCNAQAAGPPACLPCRQTRQTKTQTCCVWLR